MAINRVIIVIYSTKNIPINTAKKTIFFLLKILKKKKKRKEALGFPSLPSESKTTTPQQHPPIHHIIQTTYYPKLCATTIQSKTLNFRHLELHGLAHLPLCLVLFSFSFMLPVPLSFKEAYETVLLLAQESFSLITEFMHPTFHSCIQTQF